MKIDGIKSNNSFQGYYKLPKNKVNAEIINNHLQPLMNEYNKAIFVFSGKNPFASDYVKNLQELANKNGVQAHWLRNNAKNYGVELPNDELDTIFVATEYNDTNNVLSLCQNIIIGSVFNLTKAMAKNFLRLFKPVAESKPYWLDGIKVSADTYKKAQIKFDKFIKTKNVKELDNASELIQAIQNEINA